MKKEIKINHIEIAVGGKTLQLSPNEVKELRTKLDELIEPCNRLHYHWYNSSPYTITPTVYPSNPIWLGSSGTLTTTNVFNNGHQATNEGVSKSLLEQ